MKNLFKPIRKNVYFVFRCVQNVGKENFFFISSSFFLLSTPIYKFSYYFVLTKQTYIEPSTCSCNALYQRHNHYQPCTNDSTLPVYWKFQDKPSVKIIYSFRCSHFAFYFPRKIIARKYEILGEFTGENSYLAFVHLIGRIIKNISSITSDWIIYKFEITRQTFSDYWQIKEANKNLMFLY